MQLKSFQINLHNRVWPRNSLAGHSVSNCKSCFEISRAIIMQIKSRVAFRKRQSNIDFSVRSANGFKLAAITLLFEYTHSVGRPREFRSNHGKQKTEIDPGSRREIV